MLRRMDDHAFAVVADCDGGLVPLQPSVYVAMGPVDCRVVGHHFQNVLPVASWRDAAVSLDNIFRMARRYVIEDHAPGCVGSHQAQKWVDPAWQGVWYLGRKGTVADNWQICDCVANGRVRVGSAGTVGWVWERPVCPEVFRGVPEITVDSQNEESA